MLNIGLVLLTLIFYISIHVVAFTYCSCFKLSLLVYFCCFSILVVSCGNIERYFLTCTLRKSAHTIYFSYIVFPVLLVTDPR